MLTRVECSACAIALNEDKKYCYECGGKGYIERFTRLPNCTSYKPECPITYNPMVDGWECDYCGAGGPIN